MRMRRTSLALSWTLLATAFGEWGRARWDLVSAKSLWSLVYLIFLGSIVAFLRGHEPGSIGSLLYSFLAALLGAEELPAGYSVELALDLPLSVELVALTADDRQFVYTRGIGRSNRIADFAAGDLDLLAGSESGTFS